MKLEGIGHDIGKTLGDVTVTELSKDVNRVKPGHKLVGPVGFPRRIMALGRRAPSGYNLVKAPIIHRVCHTMQRSHHLAPVDIVKSVLAHA